MLKTWSVKTAGTTASAIQGLMFPFSNSPSSLWDVSEVQNCCHQTVLGQLRPPDPQQVTRNLPQPFQPKGLQATQPQGQNKTNSTAWREHSAVFGTGNPRERLPSSPRGSHFRGAAGILHERGYKHLYKQLYKAMECHLVNSPQVQRASSDKLLYKVQGGMHTSRTSNNKRVRNKTFSPVTLEALSTSSLDFCSLRQSFLACGLAHEFHSPLLHCKHITAPRSSGTIKNSTVSGDNPSDNKIQPARGSSCEVRPAGTARHSLSGQGPLTCLGMEWAVAGKGKSSVSIISVSDLVLL